MERVREIWSERERKNEIWNKWRERERKKYGISGEREREFS